MALVDVGVGEFKWTFGWKFYIYKTIFIVGDEKCWHVEVGFRIEIGCMHVYVTSDGRIIDKNRILKSIDILWEDTLPSVITELIDWSIKNLKSKESF
jgi:hypothetical protein